MIPIYLLESTLLIAPKVKETHFKVHLPL